MKLFKYRHGSSTIAHKTLQLQLLWSSRTLLKLYPYQSSYSSTCSAYFSLMESGRTNPLGTTGSFSNQSYITPLGVSIKTKSPLDFLTTFGQNLLCSFSWKFLALKY